MCYFSVRPPSPLRHFFSKYSNEDGEAETVLLPTTCWLFSVSRSCPSSPFDTENEKRSRQDNLEQVVDDLRKKHGTDAIRLGSQDNKEIGVTRREKD